ncbi:hypothetical protein JG687_00015180, partial [Phytophthora cactorum]
VVQALRGFVTPGSGRVYIQTGECKGPARCANLRTSFHFFACAMVGSTFIAVVKYRDLTRPQCDQIDIAGDTVPLTKTHVP